MNELQIGLLALGALAIAGVYAFNRWQQRRYQREAEAALRRDQTDVLLESAPAPGEERTTYRTRRAPIDPIEPSLKLDPVKLAPSLEPKLNHIVLLSAEQPVQMFALKQAIERSPFSAKPVRWQGRGNDHVSWEEIDFDAPSAYRVVRAGVQLANRAGPISASELAGFRAMVQGVAEQLGFSAEFPDEDSALRQAQELDAFCATFDILFSLNVVSQGAGSMTGRMIANLAQAEGMVARGDGVYALSSESGDELFTLSNQDGPPLRSSALENLTTRALVFLLDVPRVRDAVQAFARMSALAQRFASELGAAVVDDRGQPLHAEGIAAISVQLQQIVNQMTERGIPAGGPAALQLFSE